jgi:putative oxidoreductase
LIPEPRNRDSNQRLVVPSLARLGAGLEPLIYFLIRVSAGLFLAMHGAQKLLGWFGGNAAAEAAAFARLELEPAHMFVVVTGTVELGSGLMMMLGLLTRPAAAAASGLLTVATFMLRTQGFDWTRGGYEYAMLWALTCLLVFARGGGSWSVDHAIGIQI